MLRSRHCDAIRIGGAMGRFSRDTGSIILAALLILTLLVALAAAQFVVLQKNVRASSYFLSYSDLKKCAESGIDLAIHDLTYSVSANGGKVGTVDWVPANDVGRDGIGGTSDQGEGDGIPTIGEPNVIPQPIGPSNMGAGIMVHVATTVFPDTWRVVASVGNSEAVATVDTFVRKTIIKVPKVAAVFVDPDVALDLKGNAFRIDGNDHNVDGTPGPEAAVPGIATFLGTPAGSNQAILLSQIAASNYDQILGAGASPSLGEVDTVDFAGLMDNYKQMATNVLPSGTYTTPSIGNYAANDFKITRVDGDLHLSGTSEGAGVLVVNGSLRVSGQLSFYGIVLVQGDITLVGGGSEIHTWGTVLVGESLTAVDPAGLETELTVAGTADLFYSSAVLQKIQDILNAKYSVIYYDDR